MKSNRPLPSERTRLVNLIVPLLLISCLLPVLALLARHAPAVSSHSAQQQASPATRPLTHTLFLPHVIGPLPSQMLIAAAHIDSAISGEGDEAILLWNVGPGAQNLAGWQLTTGTRRATFPLTTTLMLRPGERIWCTAQASIFQQSFGTLPSCVWNEDSSADLDPADLGILRLNGKLQLVNGGGDVQLWNAQNTLVDVLLYGDESQPINGWQGTPTQLYTRGNIPRVGQVIYRKSSPITGDPIDSDQATDWAGDLADLSWGRRVWFPGWRMWDDPALTQPAELQATATVTVAVGPEGLYQPLQALFANATTSIDLSIYTLEHRELAQTLADAVRRGVRVRILLEGSPPGGIDDAQRWAVAQIAQAGGEVRYIAVQDDAPNGYRPRYRFAHAKYGLVDGRIALNGTENMNHDSMPVPSGVPVGGRRGFYLITDAVPVIAHLKTLFDIDWAPGRFLDLQPYVADHPKYGDPSPDFVWPEPNLYEVVASPFGQPLVTQGDAHFNVVSAPENSLYPEGGLLTLINQAGPGDEILFTQLYEHKHWGDTNSNPIADPNPRLAAAVAAARRGASVRLLLDGYFDDGEGLRSNRATVAYVQTVAAAEGLDMDARLGNPTQGGIHAKVVLIRLGDVRWSGVGSLNGGEVSHKLNREVLLLTDLTDVHSRLSEVFEWDWVLSAP